MEAAQGIQDFAGIRTLTFSKEHVPAPSAALTMAGMSEVFPHAGNPVLEVASTVVVASMGAAAIGKHIVQMRNS